MLAYYEFIFKNVPVVEVKSEKNVHNTYSDGMVIDSMASSIDNVKLRNPLFKLELR
jgi:hypothetical protein